jgi:hypothetical protein
MRQKQKIICETIIAGQTVFKRIFAGKEKPEQTSRATKRNATIASVREMNDRNAARRLSVILNHNFVDGDLHLVTTYRGAEPSAIEAKEELSKGIRRIRSLYRKHDIEFRYIAVTEYVNKRIHHHIICTGYSGGITFDDIRKCWIRGAVRPTWLYSNGDYTRLASYLIKETSKTFREPDAVFRRRYSCSRNIEIPEVFREPVDIEESYAPSIPKGWELIEETLFEGENPYSGKRYLEYAIRKQSPAARYRKRVGTTKGRQRSLETMKWLAEHQEFQAEFDLIDLSGISSQYGSESI